MSTNTGADVVLLTGTGGKLYYAFNVLAKEWIGSGGRVFTNFRDVKDYSPAIAEKINSLQTLEDLREFWLLDSGRDLFVFDLTWPYETASYFCDTKESEGSNFHSHIRAMSDRSMILFLCNYKSQLTPEWIKTITLDLDCRIRERDYVSVYSKAELIDHRLLSESGK